MASSHERVIDDIAILEAALDRATERKRGLSAQGTPTRTSGTVAFDDQAAAQERERFGTSFSTYAKQLKNWVDMQVDARLKLTLQNIDAEVLISRQESRTALDGLAKIEHVVLSVDDQTRRETVEVQQETLSTVADLMHTVDELKRTFAHDHRLEIDEMRRLQGEHEIAFGEIRQLQAEHRKDIEMLMAQNEDKLAIWRNELVDDLSAEIRKVDATGKQQLCIVEGQLESLRNEVASAARQADLEELQRLFEKAQRRLGDDLLAHQQRMINELRAETQTAFKNEAASVTALDEQMWVTDQRLGQRIDKVVQQCRDCAISVDDLVRSHNDILRSHQESMSRIKVLAQSHRDGFRSRSPEYHKVTNHLTERPPSLRSPFCQDFTTGEVDEDRIAGESRRPLSSRGIGAGLLRKTQLRSSSKSSAGSLSRAEGGLNMAKVAGDTFAEIGSRADVPRGSGSSRGDAGGGLAMARVAGEALNEIAQTE